MFKWILHTAIILVLFFTPPVFAQDDDLELAELEAQLYGLINNARVNPLETIASLGMDTNQILADLPDLHDILTNGLPPLYYNLKLRQAAWQHTSDMLENDYYDTISLDGTTPETRIQAANYVPKASGETLGVLGFINLVKASDAVNSIFENMLKDELDPSRTERRYILASDMEEVGIGFGTGRISLGGSRLNAYLVTCDWGASKVSDLEMQLLEMINQARKNPLLTAFELGMDTDKIWFDLPEIHDILINGLPPLNFNAVLYRSASDHANDMLTNDYYSKISLDGRSVEQRIIDAGYIPVIATESMRMLVTTDYVSPEEGAKIHFEKLFQRELEPDFSERIILNPYLKEAGISLIAKTPEIWSQKEYITLYSDYYTLLMVADFARDIEKE